MSALLPIRRILPQASTALRTAPLFTHQRARFFTTSKMTNFPTPSSDPPKKEMQYFPGMTASLPSESAEFRRVLWTGLYSQIVLMTIPVGGDIGEEVPLPVPCPGQH